MSSNSAPAPDDATRGAEAAGGRAHAPPAIDNSALAIRILLATTVGSAELYQAKWADADLGSA
ncbi:MAG: hypothetical protein IV093_01830 [Rubrivivax sp.]|nr:hypothetical protein [Rubrivivax sp.]